MDADTGLDNDMSAAGDSEFDGPMGLELEPNITKSPGLASFSPGARIDILEASIVAQSSQPYDAEVDGAWHGPLDDFSAVI